MTQKQSLYNMNTSWKFHDGDISVHNSISVHKQFIRADYTKAGNNSLALAQYDDSKWKDVTLPHDFVIERNVYDSTLASSTGSLKKGIAWYRKVFHIPREDMNGRLFLQFDGIFRNSEIWLNGCLVGRQTSGYRSMEFEVSDLVNYGSANCIAVKADANEPEGWWYEGGGIYRDVRLLKSSKIRVTGHEVFVRTDCLDLETRRANLTIIGEIDCGNLIGDTDSRMADEHAGDFNYTCKTENLELLISIDSPCGDTVFSQRLTLVGKQYHKIPFSLQASLAAIQLWDIEETNLYTIHIKVNSKNCEDFYSTTFGMRSIAYSAKSGFQLNGRTVKLKGVCGHDDFAGVGVALTQPLIEFKLQQLISMGINAYRCSHNPPDSKFLKLCDQWGILVMNETRLPGVSDENMGDFIHMIKRDRNHPSVICWSIANEEFGIQRTELQVQIFKKMVTIGKMHDATRPYLYASNNEFDLNTEYDAEKGLIMNPVGFNYFGQYKDDVIKRVHEKHPDWCLINTESAGTCFTRAFLTPKEDMDILSEAGGLRSIWDEKKYTNKITCYGSNRPVWGVTPEVSWKAQVDRIYCAGMFLWTGFDYRGEVFPFDYPAKISFYGIIDFCGFPKDWYYYMKANWTDKPVLHLLPHWNLDLTEGTPVNVWAFTNCSEVELLINGISQGRKQCQAYSHLEWAVTYEKGTIEAIGYLDGLEVIRDKKVTAGPPVKLVLETNKNVLQADGEDAVIIAAHLVDIDGHMVMTSDEVIEFTFEGPCEFLGTGNGDHFSDESDKEPIRSLFVGRCITIAKATRESGCAKIIGHWKDQQSIIEVESMTVDYMEVIPSITSIDSLKRVEDAADGGI